MGPAHPAELRVRFPLGFSSPAPCIPLQRVLLKWLGASRHPFSCPCPVWSLQPPRHMYEKTNSACPRRLLFCAQLRRRLLSARAPDAMVEICGDGFPSSFLPSNTTFPLTAAFLTQTVCLDDTTVKFEIWDTAGQERYHSLAPMYYRGAQAAIVVYDITNTVKIFPLLLDPCFWTGSGLISSVVWGVSPESSGWRPCRHLALPSGASLVCGLGRMPPLSL